MPRVQAGQMPITDDDLAYARRLLHDLPAPVRDVAISWYPMAHDMIRLWALETGFSVAQCAGVLAVYSQNTAWHVNVAYAKQALYEGRIVGMRRVTANVRAILAGEPICQHLTEGL